MLSLSLDIDIDKDTYSFLISDIKGTKNNEHFWYIYLHIYIPKFNSWLDLVKCHFWNTNKKVPFYKNYLFLYYM